MPLKVTAYRKHKCYNFKEKRVKEKKTLTPNSIQSLQVVDSLSLFVTDH